MVMVRKILPARTGITIPEYAPYFPGSTARQALTAGETGYLASRSVQTQNASLERDNLFIFETNLIERLKSAGLIHAIPTEFVGLRDCHFEVLTTFGSPSSIEWIAHNLEKNGSRKSPNP